MRQPHRSRIHTSDPGAVKPAWRRTLVVRVLVAAALLALFLVEVRAARGLQARPGILFPQGRAGVLVLDLSASITTNEYPRIAKLLHDVATRDEPLGLVIFSDAPYEALPPGSPGHELRAYLRYFTPLRRRGGGVYYRANPWSQSFRAGTRISSALELARALLKRDKVDRGTVVLASDLAAAPGDVPALTQTLLRFRQGPYSIRLVPLDATDRDKRFFARFVGPDALAPAPQPDKTTYDLGAPPHAPAPRTLLAAGLLLLLVLAASERWLGRLDLPRRRTA